MRGARRRKRRQAGTMELNMAPLIDMIFILLIFFLVTTSFVKEAGVEIARPVANTATVDQRARLMIGITRQGVIYVEGRPMDIRSLRGYMTRFLARSPGASVVIVADRESRTGTVIRVLDECKMAGVKNISVAARRPAR